MPFNFLGMHPKTSFKVLGTQAPLVLGPQVIDAPTASKMAVYQDAYRKADTLLRQKIQKEILKTQVANTIQDGRKIVPTKHEDQVTHLEQEFTLAHEELSGLRTQLADAKEGQHTMQQALDNAHSALAGHRASQSQVELAHNSLHGRFNALFEAYNGLVADKTSLEQDLFKAQAKNETDKVHIGDALTALYLEQEKTKDLEKKLAASDALLTAANDRAASLDSDLDDLLADLADTADSEGSFSFSASTYELELERDMYQSQEQEALEALDAEKTIRLALEKDLEASRAKEQQAIATSEAHEQARVKADKEKLEISAQLKAAVATIAELTAAILEEEEDDDTTCEDLQTLQNGCVAMQNRMESVQNPFQPTNFDAQTSFWGIPAYDYFANTPIKPAHTNKENLGVVFRTPRSIHVGGLIFSDPVSFADVPSTPAYEGLNPFATVGTQSDLGISSEFDDSIFGPSSPALF